MKIICVEVPVNSSKIHLNRTYTLSDIIWDDAIDGNSIWYMIEEASGSKYHSSLFAISPDQPMEDIKEFVKKKNFIKNT